MTMKTLILAGDVIVSVQDVGTVQEDNEGWHVPGEGRWPRNAGVTGTADVDVPDGFEPRAWVLVDGELVSNGWEPVDNRPLQLLPRLAFRDLVISVVGDEAWQAARTDPLLFVANDVLNCAEKIDAADLPAYWAGVVALGHFSQNQVDAITAAWPRA